MVSRFKFRHQYDLESELAAERETAIEFNDPSLTQQQYTDEVNLNTMVARFGIKDGSIPPGAFDPKLFGPIVDMGEGHNLKDALDAAREAQAMFMQLPATIRNRFNNDAGSMMDFVFDPRNAEEAVRLGLLRKDTPVANDAPVVKQTP